MGEFTTIMVRRRRLHNSFRERTVRCEAVTIIVDIFTRTRTGDAYLDCGGVFALPPLSIVFAGNNQKRRQRKDAAAVQTFRRPTSGHRPAPANINKRLGHSHYSLQN
jgi:hypothetical protein